MGDEIRKIINFWLYTQLTVIQLHMRTTVTVTHPGDLQIMFTAAQLWNGAVNTVPFVHKQLNTAETKDVNVYLQTERAPLRECQQ